MEEFDYVIIGAGSAGCVLTNRIINSGKYKVLLIEAGGNDSYPSVSYTHLTLPTTVSV